MSEINDWEVLKTAYEFGSEAYWRFRDEGEQMPQCLMDRLIAIADKLIGTEERK